MRVGTGDRLPRMNGVTPGTTECEQTVNAIYVWARILQVNDSDADLRERALERIEQNAGRLLARLRAEPEESV